MQQDRQMKKILGSEAYSDYSRLSPEEKEKLDQEWAKNVKRTRPKDYRDD